MGMPAPFDGYVERPARVSSTCLVTVARNRYSVPCEWAGHMVSTRLYPGRVDVVAGDALVASHERVLNRGQTVFDWQHYIELVQRKPGALRNGAPFADMPRPLAQLRHALMRHTGGDRVLSEVLALVPTAGLDTLLVAVELVLEHATPSGHISVEHVRNVLARLSDPQRPPPADTALALREAPRADTHRYDRLRAADGPCELRLPANSRACGCTAWPAPGMICWGKGRRRRCRVHAGCWSTCCRPKGWTGRCVRCPTR